jgi:hypothetical protein
MSRVVVMLSAVRHLFLLLFFVGCVATVEDRPMRPIYVLGPPPPPLAEARAAPASSGMVWVGGYWHWNGVQYVWIPGHWDSPPPGQTWLAPRYMVQDGRYVYHAGRWSPRDRATVVIP